MNITDFIICALAASAIVDVWFNGSIFADYREMLAARSVWCNTPECMRDVDTGYADGEGIEPLDTWVNKCPCLVVQLLNCAHCLSFHTPVWIFCWYLCAGLFAHPFDAGLRLPVYALAATRLMNLITHVAGKPYQQQD